MRRDKDKHNFDFLSCNRKANVSINYIAKKDLVYIPILGLKSNCNRKQTSHGTNFRSHSSPLSTRSLHFSGVKALRRSFGFVSARSHMWIDSMVPNHKISPKTALQQSLNLVYMSLSLSRPSFNWLLKYKRIKPGMGLYSHCACVIVLLSILTPPLHQNLNFSQQSTELSQHGANKKHFSRCRTFYKRILTHF